MSNTVALNILWTMVPSLNQGSLADSSVVCGACQELGTSNRVELVGRKSSHEGFFRVPIRFASISDEALLLHVREGCLDAMGVLFDRHCGLVSSIAFKLLRGSTEAQVVVEEVFYEVFLNAKQFDSKKASVEEWFVRSAFARSVNRRRLTLQGRVKDKSQVEGVEETW